ncbi:hypothetical protein [Pectobacterium parmentieri]|nr:hypothetical protein [Pectobacterium parmentieri]ACX86020.1 hypothetical protein Pecwa_0164 [Pectobacterium parmentieri WPP163]
MRNKKMNIDKSICKLVSFFKLNESNMGRMDYQVEGIPNLRCEIPLNGEILHFYTHTLLEDKPTFHGGAYLQLIEIDELSNILLGWRSSEENDAWNDDFIIFAERNGDVLYCDLSDITSPVYGSIQKRNFQISNSLSEFIEIYTKVLKIEIEDFYCDVTDDDFNFKPEYLLAVENELKKVLSSEFVANYMLFFYE